MALALADWRRIILLFLLYFTLLLSRPLPCAKSGSSPLGPSPPKENVKNEGDLATRQPPKYSGTPFFSSLQNTGV